MLYLQSIYGNKQMRLSSRVPKSKIAIWVQWILRIRHHHIYISPSPILSYDGGWVCVGGWYPQNLWNMQFGGHKGFSHLFHHFNSFRPFTVSHFYLINSSGESVRWDGIWDVCFLFRRCCLWLLHFSNYVITLRSEVMDGWMDR